MQSYELDTIIEQISYADRGAWDLTRMNMYITAQCNSKKKLKLTDIMEFPWDKDAAAERQYVMTMDERLEMQKKADAIGQKLSMKKDKAVTE